MLDKNEFFSKYKVEDEYNSSGLSWNTLTNIFDDYILRQKEIEMYCKKIEKYISDNIPKSVHSIKIRKKDPEHLIEKIIRKRGKEQNCKYKDINISNYREIVRDLIGIRILVVSKEEWEDVFQWISDKFSCGSTEIAMAEKPVAYIRYGDRNIYKNKIYTEHSNKGYRSQHYIVKYEQVYCEIQARTLAEEVYGEFDHKVKYPYRNNNKFLKRYTSTMSQMINAIDEMISTCFQMGELGWEYCQNSYDDDQYIDWQKLSQKIQTVETKVSHVNKIEDNEQINFGDYANRFLLRKD